MTAQRMITMRVANMVPDMEYNLNQSQQSLAVALQQVTTGLRVNQPSDDPQASATMTISLASSATVDQYTKNIGTVTSQMQTADSALSSMVSSLNTAVTLGTSGISDSLTTANKQAIVSEVEGVMNTVVAEANTAFQGVYLFAGSASSTPPVVQASTIYTSSLGSTAPPLSPATPLTAGSVTSVSDASTGQTLTFTAAAGDTIGTLQTAIANAAAAGTISASAVTTFVQGKLEIGSGSTTDGIVVSSNDPAFGTMTATPGSAIPNSYAYVGNSAVNTVQVGNSLGIATNLPGDQLFAAGANVLGSLSGLISALQNGTPEQVQTANSALSVSLASVTQQRVPLDNSISELSSQESFLSQETLTLSTQQTGLVGINLAISATNLAQAETTNSAVLAAAAKVLPQTLLSYLSQG
jgi:flagellin-like hook-associated protein FlgL